MSIIRFREAVRDSTMEAALGSVIELSTCTSRVNSMAHIWSML